MPRCEGNNRWHRRNVKDGPGQSAAEALVGGFARKADVSNAEALDYVRSGGVEGIQNSNKAEAFRRAVGSDYLFDLLREKVAKIEGAPSMAHD